jgi:myo-inositol-1(or 4)-monophosphatase
MVGDGGIAARREVAERAAREAGSALAAAFGGSFRVENKGAIDLVTEMDRIAEKIVLERIRAAFPRDAVMAEESGGALGSGNLWIVDPLDGTTNFAHGHPQFCVSIGFAIAGEPRCGVIYDPLRAEMFCAEKGRGATLNGKALRVSGVATLNESLVATGFPYDRRERADFYMPFYRAAVIATQGVRRAGAAALDLAWVACGRCDAYFEFGIKPWDVCAGSLLVTEAGGKMSDMRGGPHRLDAPHVLASNGLLHEETVGLIASAWPPAT